MNKKRRLTILIPLIAVCILAVTAVSVMGAYYAKGKFKDVFVNKQEYFLSDVLHSVTSPDAEKYVIDSAGQARDVFIYNHSPASGDYNAFDLTFDIYAWADAELPAGKEYRIIVGSTGMEYTVSGTAHAAPVAAGIVLGGGHRSTEMVTAVFPYDEEEDLTGVPGLHIVAVPTSPERMATSAFMLGVVIRPTHSDTFSFSASFEKNGNVGENAAFVYNVGTVGNAPDGGTLVVRWNSEKITLKQVNKQAPASVVEEVSGNFDRKITLPAQSNHTDTLVFFRNANRAEDGEAPTGSWDAALDEVATPGVTDESLWAILEGFVTVESVIAGQE